MDDNLSVVLQELQSSPQLNISMEATCSFICWVVRYKPMNNVEILTEFNRIHSSKIKLEEKTLYSALNYCVVNGLILVGYLTDKEEKIRINMACPSSPYYERMVNAWQTLSTTWSPIDVHPSN